MMTPLFSYTKLHELWKTHSRLALSRLYAEKKCTHQLLKLDLLRLTQEIVNYISRYVILVTDKQRNSPEVELLGSDEVDEVDESDVVSIPAVAALVDTAKYCEYCIIKGIMKCRYENELLQDPRGAAYISNTVH